MRTKKLTDQEFADDILNYELAKVGHSIDTIKQLPETSDDRNELTQSNWFSVLEFKTVEDYLDYKRHFFEKYKEWQPRYNWHKKTIVREFQWFDMSYGLSTKSMVWADFVKQIEGTDDIFYKEVYGRKKSK